MPDLYPVPRYKPPLWLWLKPRCARCGSVLWREYAEVLMDYPGVVYISCRFCMRQWRVTEPCAPQAPTV